MSKQPKANGKQFSTKFLSLYHGPQVKIKIGNHEHEYVVSKNLLSMKSPYFAKMFESNFAEGRTQSATLQEEEYLTPKSFEAFLQWLYAGDLKFDLKTPSDQIMAAIELAILGNMWLIPELEKLCSDHIEVILKATQEEVKDHKRTYNTNVVHLKSEHITAAFSLPRKHSVRTLLAMASVEGFYRASKFKLENDSRENAEYALDLLQKVREVKDQMTSTIVFHDPFSGRYFNGLK